MTTNVPGSHPCTKPVRSEDSKIKQICDLIEELDYTPKLFLEVFLKNENAAVARRFWGTHTGWPSTLRLLNAISEVVCKKSDGEDYWQQYILSEATKIVAKQKPPRGAYPKGAYHNAKTISPNLFSPKFKSEFDWALSEEHMPFLFNLLYNKMNNQPREEVADNVDSENEKSDPEDTDSEDECMFNGKTVRDRKKKASYDHPQRARVTALTITSMVAFVCNRWNNGKQLANSITLLACGVTDRVNTFLRYIGLSSSRQTAHNALKRLSYQSKRRIGFKMMSPLEHPSLATFLCFDNLDFEQKVHTKSLGHSNHMFHGTWGYLHQLNPKLLASVPSSELTLESYNQSMSKVSNLQFQPRMFVPQPEEDLHWTLVLKSQIAQAMLKQVAEASDSKVSIAT
ncbi:hypothetical protein PCASD_24644 [Puccinia coronata f. sp. avenae]|uniref:Uncharacterized protein n=1 Tax=Puccinia coronata f. sp. avenae TaxID=200324 RepID=A0A2N5S9R2_9BASI|nr:hypothetical protein PCASD_24644 [Puccinia coronata f. sp. avenae]